MALLLLFAALLRGATSSVLHGSRFLTGEVGGSLTHQCFYPITPANKYERKYWCKVAPSGACHTVVSSSGYVARGYKGRAALQDAPRDGTFTVRVTGLRSGDAGAYRCGIGPTGAGLFARQHLSVWAAGQAPGPVQLVRGHLGGSVSVRCPPGSDRGASWCKLGRGGCVLVADGGGYVQRRYEGRVALGAAESSGAFQVLMNDLKTEDAGTYVCGAAMPNGTSGPRAVELRVTAASAIPRRARFLSRAVGSSWSLQCHHEPRRSFEEKYVCRWRAGQCQRLADAGGFVHGSYEGRVRVAGSDREQGTFTVVLADLREEDAGWYWCGARSGLAEQTSSVKLHVRRGPHSSQGLEMSAVTDPTSSAPATYSTSTQSSVTSQTCTEAGCRESTSSLVTTLHSATFETARKEIHRGSATSESRLLFVVLPALVGLLLIIVTILILTKMKLHKEAGRERSAPGRLEAAPFPDPVEEQMLEKTVNSEKLQESKTDSGESRITYAILGRFRQTNLFVRVYVFQQGKKMLFDLSDGGSRERGQESYPSRPSLASAQELLHVNGGTANCNVRSPTFHLLPCSGPGPHQLTA